MTMPSFRDLLSALALAMTMVMGRVTNLTVSNTIQSGQNLTAVLEITSYSQNWDDFGVIWGLKPAERESTVDVIGFELSYNNLYPATSEDLGNMTLSIPVPEGTDAGDYILTAAIPYLVGASGSTGIRYFNRTLSVTD